MSEPNSAFRCADAARVRADPLAGSAPPARRWLLLEHPGPWKIDAIAGSGIDSDVRSALLRKGGSATRILLVRRPGRIDRRAPRRWILAGLDSATLTGRWRDDHDLLDAADAMIATSPPSMAPPQPLILVCTHGVHDVCCALRGRPVASALASRWPELVWECSHIGGDRFAPNVVMLPDGFYYGNLDPDYAVATVEAHLTGAVLTERLRGMARFLPPVQAAVIAAYQRYGPLGPADVTVRAAQHFGPHQGHGSETIVDLVIEPRKQLVRVQVLSVRRPDAQLTCRATHETPATEYRIIDFSPKLLTH
ncbi:MAG TPA: sucrase ferredoxin [Propionibacteriaceae bacterium]|nr:sucrase ferredoxin [Propionibacteriaceae bacterium]